MKKYSDILKQQVIKKKSYKIPHGWVLLKWGKNNELVIEKNKNDFSGEYIDYNVEERRQYELYIKNIKRLDVLTKKSIKYFDVVILMTDHDKLNYREILSASKKIIDCRGRFQISQKVYRA